MSAEQCGEVVAAAGVVGVGWHQLGLSGWGDTEALAVVHQTRGGSGANGIAPGVAVDCVGTSIAAAVSCNKFKLRLTLRCVRAVKGAHQT